MWRQWCEGDIKWRIGFGWWGGDRVGAGRAAAAKAGSTLTVIDRASERVKCLGELF